MNDARGKLIVDVLKNKIHKDMKCPFCYKDEFSQAEEHKIRTLNDDAYTPVVSIMCENCGYVMSFSSISLGLRCKE